MKKINRMGLKAFVAEHISNAGGDQRKGVLAAGKQLMDLAEDKQNGISLQNVGIKDLFEGLCNFNGDIDTTSSQEVQEAITAANFPAVTGALISPVIINEFEPYAAPVLELVTEVDAKHKTETYVGFGALDNFELVREGMPYDEAQPGQRKCTIENFKFGRVISVTMEMVLFDQTGDVLRVAGNIGRKAGQHLHQLVIQTVTDQSRTATGDQNNLVVDGTRRAMYASDHSSWDTAANDNAGGTSGGPNVDNLNTVNLLWSSIVDDKGDKILVNPSILLVDKSVEVTARQTVGSSQVMWTDSTSSGSKTQSGTINPFFNSYKIIGSPYVGSNKWYLGDFKMQSILQWIYRLRTEVYRGQTQASFSNDIVAQFKAGYFVGCGCTDYRYVCEY